MSSGGVSENLKEIVNSTHFNECMNTVLAVESTSDFLEQYDKNMAGEVNSARRYVDWVMTFVRTQVLLGQLTPEQATQIVPAATVRNFLERVHVLSKAKPGAKSDVADQEAFWRAIERGEPVPREGGPYEAKDPLRVLAGQMLFSSQIFLDAIVSVLQKREDCEGKAAFLRVAYWDLQADFRNGEFNRETLRLIAEPGSIRVFLDKVEIEPQRAEFWESIIQ